MIVGRTVFVSILVMQALSLVTASAQSQNSPPSRKEQLERNGIIWGSAAVWGTPFQEDISEDLKLAGLARFWMEVKVNFPHFAENLRTRLGQDLS